MENNVVELNAVAAVQLPALVDELTALQTQLAVLTARADQIKSDLAATGLSEVCGSVTRAVISQVSGSTTTDWKSLAQSFSPTEAEIARFAKAKAGYVTVSIKGYNARKAA